MVAELRQLPPATDLFLTHGLRKHGATELAEHGANALQIVSFLAHKITREALTYIRAANRKTLAEAGMALVHAEICPTFQNGWTKHPLNFLKRKGNNGTLATPAGFEPATCPLGVNRVMLWIARYHPVSY